MDVTNAAVPESPIACLLNFIVASLIKMCGPIPVFGYFHKWRHLSYIRHARFSRWKPRFIPTTYLRHYFFFLSRQTTLSSSSSSSSFFLSFLFFSFSSWQSSFYNCFMLMSLTALRRNVTSDLTLLLPDNFICWCELFCRGIKGPECEADDRYFLVPRSQSRQGPNGPMRNQKVVSNTPWLGEGWRCFLIGRLRSYPASFVTGIVCFYPVGQVARALVWPHTPMYCWG